tara:strand:- start:1028 stop:1681 length:654 start_codon:yes stop_codon:yes gene_type:complete
MLHIEKSIHPLTEFTPTWKIPFWIAKYQNEDEIDLMREWLLDHEEAIIKKYKKNANNDGGTGLGNDSLTAQYNSFNLFNETKDIDKFKNLFNFIRIEYNKFMNEFQTINRQCVIYCWANVVKHKQEITKHHHGATHDSYLSGNMHFDNYDTVTRYYNPYNEMYYDFKNVKGGLTFFPSYIYHSATTHNSLTDRVSIAFDLFDKKYINDGIDENRIDF